MRLRLVPKLFPHKKLCGANVFGLCPSLTVKVYNPNRIANVLRASQLTQAA